MKKLSQKTKERDGELRQCYVYEIRIDGVVRYIGKGRNGRIYSHLIDAMYPNRLLNKITNK